MRDSQYDAVGEQYEYFAKTGAIRPIDERTALRMAGDVSGKSVLDLACGYGHFGRELSRRGASRVLGIDISERMIELAIDKSRREGDGLEFRVGDAAHMGTIGAFDIVTAIWLFDYASSLDELASMFRSARVNLKPDGKLAAYTLNPDFSLSKGNYDKYGFRVLSEETFGSGFRLEAEFVTPEPPRITIYQWSRRAYETALKNAGFSSFEWIVPELSSEDVAGRPDEFWDIFKSNRLQAGLICYP